MGARLQMEMATVKLFFLHGKPVVLAWRTDKNGSGDRERNERGEQEYDHPDHEATTKDNYLPEQVYLSGQAHDQP